MASQKTSEEAERVNILMGQIMRRLFSGTGKKLNMPEVTTQQLRLLRILSHYDNSTMKNLAKLADVTTPTVTGLVDRMVSNGLVERVDDPKDRRIVRVKLTRKAKNLRDRWRKLRGEKIDRVLFHMNEKARKRFVRAFETIHDLLEDTDEEPRDQ